MMRHSALWSCTILVYAVILAAVLSGCGQAGSGAGVDAASAPAATVTAAATVPLAQPAATVVTPGAGAPAAVRPEAATPAPTPAYTPDLADLAAERYEGWRSYENAVYGFVLRYPADWTLTEVSDPVNTMAGHRLDLQQDSDPANRIMVAFRAADESVQILPTGMGQGECKDRGSILFMGEALSRRALVDRGADTRILYGEGGEIARGALMFWLTADRTAPMEQERAIPVEVQRIADAVLSSMVMNAR